MLAADAKSSTARKLNGLIEPQLDAYDKLKAEYGLSQEELDRRLTEVANLSPD